MKNLKIENVALVYVEFPDANVEQEMYEIRELVDTARGEIKLYCQQKRANIDANTVVGKGKLEELKNAKRWSDIDIVLFSCNLNSTQRATLKKTLNKDVIDRIDLILDIFALRATSAEGKKQVELAQLSYNLATKAEGDFSRQGAGIGTRGPGETKIETNKRTARERMFHLRQELAEIEKHREIARKKRKENNMFCVALVGYTNAGKSTLFNVLTNSNIYADDKLFATLDTTVRKVSLKNDVEVLICDTVGFINDLPHALLNAFKSTLEEAVNADLIVHVCDVSDKNLENHMKVTEQTLAELNSTAPIIRVFNKTDKLNGNISLSELSSGKIATLFISALTQKNTDVLLDKIYDFAITQYATVKLRFSYEASREILSKLNKYAVKCSIEYKDYWVDAKVTTLKKFMAMFVRYIVFD